MGIEIINWYTKAVLYKTDLTDMRSAIEAAVIDRASLIGASLIGARLDGARLDGARLDRASLIGASLDGARLIGARLIGASLDGARLDGARLDGASLDRASLDRASLIGARLDGASLDGARLDGASLDRASLDRASLIGASLDGARLIGASLDGARLDGARLDGASLIGASGVTYKQLLSANLTAIKADFWEVLFSVPREVTALRKALIDGRVDGSQYQGKCACLVGTVANTRGCNYKNMPDLRPDSNRPAERWFLAIRESHTPETSPICKITVEWIDDWYTKVRNAALSIGYHATLETKTESDKLRAIEL